MAGNIINRESFLPDSPTDKQVYVDSYNERWIYDAQQDVWLRSGASDQLTLASASLPGYMSPQDKLLLDKVPAVGGAFGIIVDTKLLLQSSNNPEGIIQGDIKLKSDSLNIICVSKDLQPLENCKNPSTFNCEGTDLTSTGVSPGLKFELNEKFLKTLVINLRGQKGKRGVKGKKGIKGLAGYSIGPPGEAGDKGDSTTVKCNLTGITYTDVQTMTDTAVVKADITTDCKLSLTKSKINIDPTLPATKVSATPINRAITYPSDDSTTCSVVNMSNWTLSKVGEDVLPLNPTLLRLPKGSNSGNTAVHLNAGITLNDFINGMVDGYKKKLSDLDDKYLTQAKSYVDSLDSKARSILSGLAQQLAQCEFNMPSVEYCITFNKCPIIGDADGTPSPPSPPEPPLPPIPPSSGPGPGGDGGGGDGGGGTTPPISTFAAAQRAGANLNIDPNKQYFEVNMSGKSWEIRSQ